MAAEVGERFRRTAAGRPRILGHRGARRRAPENTLRAFELALGEGADGVELDVRLDGTGEVVVFHDSDLSRVTGGKNRQRVDELSTSALRSVDLGDGQAVPLLSEVLRWTMERDALVNIEVKADGGRKRALIAALRARVQACAGVEPWLLLSSFHPGLVLALSRALPGVGVCLLTHARERFLRGGAGYRLLGALGVHPEWSLVNQKRVARLKQGGGLVGAWTVNDPEVAARLASWGVDLLISDVPGELVRRLR